MFFTFFKIFTTPIHGAGDKHRHTEAQRFLFTLKHISGFSSGGGGRHRREVVFFYFYSPYPRRRGDDKFFILHLSSTVIPAQAGIHCFMYSFVIASKRQFAWQSSFMYSLFACRGYASR